MSYVLWEKNMNDKLTRKKHSKRIAELAFKKGMIDQKFYNSLYIGSYNVQRKPKRKNRYGYRHSRFYEELYYGQSDYWGEFDEWSLIYYIEDRLFWTLNKFDDCGNIINPVIRFNKTLDTIKFLSSLKNNQWQKLEKIYNENIDSMI